MNADIFRHALISFLMLKAEEQKILNWKFIFIFYFALLCSEIDRKIEMPCHPELGSAYGILSCKQWRHDEMPVASATIQRSQWKYIILKMKKA